MAHKKGQPFRVMEVFPTIQGEGTDIGRETIFMRLYGCNLACVWCDTSQSWDEAQYFRGIYQDYEIEELIKHLTEMAQYNDINHLVITGGEPLLHNHDDLTNILGNLKNVVIHTTFETNGTILPRPELSKVTGLFSVSPKLSSSKNPPYNPRLLSRWIDRAGDKLQFKFVVANAQDAKEVAEMLVEADDQRLVEVPIIFQPEESANNYRELPELVSEAFRNAGINKLAYNIRYIPQVHKLFSIR